MEKEQAGNRVFSHGLIAEEEEAGIFFLPLIHMRL